MSRPVPRVLTAVSIEEIVRLEGGRVVATLCRMTGDLGRAEDALAEAVVEALQRWPVDGIPARPGAWLTTVARRKALDALRRESTRTERETAAMTLLESEPRLERNTIRDDQLRLIFTCCHPALNVDAQVALALRVLCGLTTAEIARAFLVPEDTVGKRISRAKAKIAANRIPYRVPPDDELPARLAGVLAVISVVFTTGHHAPDGAELVRVDLAVEAIRLALLLTDLMPDEPECLGLLALLESTHARSSTRLGDDGLPVLLADADRSRWDRAAIGRSVAITERAMRLGRVGPYQLQAAISCLHGVAATVEETDWPQIVALYRLLEQLQPSLPVKVNRAVAEAQISEAQIAEAQIAGARVAGTEAAGLEVGLAMLDEIGRSDPAADGWHLFHTARADLLRRLERPDAAADAYRAALACPHNDVDDAFLRMRLAEVTAAGDGT